MLKRNGSSFNSKYLDLKKKGRSDNLILGAVQRKIIPYSLRESTDMFSAVLALLVAAVVAVNADGSNDTTAGGAGSGDDVGDHRDVLPEFCRRHPQIRLSEDYNPREGPDLGDENEGGEDGGRRRKKVPVLSNYLIPDVSGVDDHRRVMAMNIVVYKRWVDPRISASNLTEAVSLSPEFYSQCLWSPTFVYDNLHSVDNWDLIKPPAIYVVQPGPVITYSTFNKLSVSCIMNFNSYPFDVQVMPLRHQFWQILLENYVNLTGAERQLNVLNYYI